METTTTTKEKKEYKYLFKKIFKFSFVTNKHYLEFLDCFAIGATTRKPQEVKWYPVCGIF